MRIAFLLSFFLLINCSVASDNELDSQIEAEVTASKQVYNTEDSITFTIKNQGSSQVLTHRCGGSLSYKLQKRTNNEWETVNALICIAIFTPDFYDFLEAGASTNFTLPSYTKSDGIYRFGIPLRIKDDSSELEDLKEEDYFYTEIFIVE